jgi:hypothetical protein
MAAIDFTDVGGLAGLPLNVELNARVERAAAAAIRLPRMYLGASIAGDECARAIQYAWWTVPDLPARVKLVFDRGHALETLARTQLQQAGFLFAPPEALEFAVLDGYLQGHADGIIVSGPALPGVNFALPAIWEAKCLNAKNWKAVNKDGFAKTFPRYATQVSLYQRFLNKPNPALVTCVNADSCEILHFTLPFDAQRARATVERIEAIVAATRNGELLPRFTNNPKDWRCGICPHKARCWGGTA